MPGFSSIKGSGGEARRRSVWALAASMVATACLLAIPSPAFAADFVEPPCIYRLYNKWSGEHLFTASFEEYCNLDSIGWDGEWIAWYAPEKSASPVYRLYNPYSGDHHYTREEREYDHLGSIGWRQEGVAFYSSEEEDGVPVYRLYNPWLTAGTHLFTTDEEEYDSLGGIGWKKEDVAWYGLNRIASGTFGEGCTWTLDWPGTLTISPTNGVSGTMSKLLDSFPQNVFSVSKVVIAEGVKAPQDANHLFCSSPDSSGDYDGIEASTIDVKNLDVSNTTDMTQMFGNCQYVKHIYGLSNWDVSKVTTMDAMFAACVHLADISGLENWDTSSVTSMSEMFWACTTLKDLNALALWDVSNVTDMGDMDEFDYEGGMFSHCESLTDISGLKGWDVSKVEDMYAMFVGCSSLADVSLSLLGILPQLLAWKRCSMDVRSSMISSI